MSIKHRHEYVKGKRRLMEQISFNEHWLFKIHGKSTTEITLPHDAQLLDGRGNDSPGGSGHAFFYGNIYDYEKYFHVPKEWKEKHIEILFEGVYRNAVVSLNGQKIAEHKYGYTPFNISLDEHLQYGAENVLCVEVDNSKLPNSRCIQAAGYTDRFLCWLAPGNISNGRDFAFLRLVLIRRRFM